MLQCSPCQAGGCVLRSLHYLSKGLKIHDLWDVPGLAEDFSEYTAGLETSVLVVL